MKFHALLVGLIVGSNVIAQELIMDEDKGQSVLNKIMNCQVKLTAIATDLDDASTVKMSQARSQGILLIDGQVKNFGKSIGDSNYYLRFFNKSAVVAENSKTGIIDSAKLTAMFENYKQTQKLHSDIFLSEQEIKDLKLNAIYTFQLVQNNKTGSLYSDDGLDEGIRVQVSIDPISYKKEVERLLNEYAKHINSGSVDIHSHLGDLTGYMLVDLLSEAPASSRTLALEKLDSALPKCK